MNAEPADLIAHQKPSSQPPLMAMGPDNWRPHPRETNRPAQLRQLPTRGAAAAGVGLVDLGGVHGHTTFRRVPLLLLLQSTRRKPRQKQLVHEVGGPELHGTAATVQRARRLVGPVLALPFTRAGGRRAEMDGHPAIQIQVRVRKTRDVTASECPKPPSEP